jgi:copper oxidase (laccase) domain-containing protein
MIIHDNAVAIYFGNAQDKLFPAEYLQLPAQNVTNLFSVNTFAHLQASMQLKSLYFLHQVHGINGFRITKNSRLLPFAQEGDFLLTNVPSIGLGIMTGDCLPIIFYDQEHHAIAIAHAGWKGSVQSIATIVLECMQKEFATNFNLYKNIFWALCAAVLL